MIWLPMEVPLVLLWSFSGVNQSGVVAMEVTNHALWLSEGSPFFLLTSIPFWLSSSSTIWILLKINFSRRKWMPIALLLSIQLLNR